MTSETWTRAVVACRARLLWLLLALPCMAQSSDSLPLCAWWAAVISKWQCKMMCRVCKHLHGCQL